MSGFAGYAGYLLLPERLAPSPMWRKVGYGSVELVDATHLKCVGLHGKVWRIHCLSSLLTQQVRQVIGTRAKVAENLQHFVLQAGNISVHDGGYGSRDRVAQSSEAGAFTVTAFSPCTFPMQDEKGKALDGIKWLKRQRARAGRICSTPVLFEHDGKRFEARVVALRRTKEQTEQARRRKCKKASKGQRKLQPDTLYLAGWLLVLTTLPVADWSDQARPQLVSSPLAYRAVVQADQAVAQSTPLTGRDRARRQKRRCMRSW